MSLADYLAKNYLNADKAPDKDKRSKKRKRKGASEGLVIADDDATGWESKASSRADEDDGPVTVATGRTAEFRKSKASSWKTLSGEVVRPESFTSSKGSAAHQSKNPANNDAAAADAIIASAVAENAARGDNDDEAPAIADNDNDGPRMESGARAGLQSAADLAAQLKRAQMLEQAGDDNDPIAVARAQDTIYRDASGRIVNIAMKRAEARAAAEAEEKKKLLDEQAARGDVQNAERAQRRQDLADAKYLTVARHADDADLNRELRERERWNDPALQFMPREEKKASSTGRPLYRGDAPPNRYGIRPGHRWDGVDRGNGFEKEYFAAQNRRRNIKDLQYAWQTDE